MPENDGSPSGRGAQSPRAQTRARRVVRVRRGVAAASLATFALTWGVIAGTGSMGASTSTSSASAPAAASSSYQRQDDDEWGFDDGAASQAAQSRSPALTTRQS